MPYPSTVIPQSTLRLYEQALYTVDLPSGQLTLRIGQPEPRLQRLLAPFPGRGAALITAWNPEGVTLPATDNERRAAELLDHVASLGHPVFPAGGSAPDWSFHEPGLAVLGLTLEAASHLGRTYRQNALVWIPPTGTPELLLLR